MSRLPERQQVLTPAEESRLEQERIRRPLLRTLVQWEEELDRGVASHAFYDHVADAVYVLVLRPNGSPSPVWRKESEIDPNPNNRKYRTVEDPPIPQG